MPLAVLSNQKVRVEFVAFDYFAAVDNNEPALWFNFYVKYTDNSKSEVSTMSCTDQCIDGFFFNGFVDIEQDREDKFAHLVIDGYASSLDKITISKVTLGDMKMETKVFGAADGFLQCDGKITSSVFFGNSGVGKSTVASLSSTIPGLFEAKSSIDGTTTLGTWISTSMTTEYLAKFSDNEFYPFGQVEELAEIPPIFPTLNDSAMYNFLDTEGLGHQTEFGDNYDMVTILPHISQNVFLVMSERILPEEIDQLIEKMVNAAEQTNGTFTFRNGKNFGNLFIVVNKAQDIVTPDEEILNNLKLNNPSLVLKINKHFQSGPEIIVLPPLPDSCRPDEITYESIRTCPTNIQERMFYGLHKIASYSIRGQSSSPDYFINCQNYEEFLQFLYESKLIITLASKMLN